MSPELDVTTAAVPADEVDELQRLRQRLSLVGTAARVGLWEYDFERDALWVSDELAHLYGLRADTFTWDEFAERLHPDDLTPVLARPAPSFPLGRVNEFLFRVRHADGRYRTVRSRSVTHGEEGRPLRKLGIHIDMSDDALHRLAELSEANERLRQFTAMACHDLRSPVRGIGRLADFLVEDHGEHLGEEVLAHLEKIRERADRLDRLVGDMVAFAASGCVDPVDGLTDITAMLADIRSTVDHRQARLLLSSAVPTKVRVAGHSLSSCVRNLVDNACKHHDKPDGVVTVVVDRHGDWLRIEVSDDGPGIDPRIRDRMFEPFLTSDPTQGSGLGLAFVRREVEANDGTIEVESTPGEGSTFVLHWPVVTVGPDRD